MSKAQLIKVADESADQVRPEAVLTIAVAAWGLGIVIALALHTFFPPGAPSVATTKSQTTIAAATRPLVASAAAATVVAPALRAATPLRRPAEPSRTRDTKQPARDRAAAGPNADPPAPQPQTQPTPAAAAAEPERAEDTRAVAAATTPGAVGSRAATLEPEGAPPPSAAGKTPPKRPLTTLTEGVVAYMRCDGLERAKERFPCPRDRALEASVWKVLEEVPACAAADPGRGTAEVRLTLRRQAAPAIEWKPGADKPSLNLRALSKCAAPKLAGARTRLRSPHTIVSFRFRLK